jgi:hypothetical protein
MGSFGTNLFYVTLGGPPPGNILPYSTPGFLFYGPLYFLRELLNLPWTPL